MKVLISSDDYLSCDGELIQRVEGVVAGALEPFEERISRVDVRLSDQDSQNLGERDKSCRLEARLAGLPAVVAYHDAPTLTEAIHAAADKLKRSVAQSLRDSATNLTLAVSAASEDLAHSGLLSAPITGGGGRLSR